MRNKPGWAARGVATQKKNRTFPCSKCGKPSKRWIPPDELGEDSNRFGSAPSFPFCAAHVPQGWREPGTLEKPIQPKRDIWPDA